MTLEEEAIKTAAKAALGPFANPYAKFSLGNLAATFKQEGRGLSAQAVADAQTKIDNAFARDPAGAALALGPILGKLVETAGAFV